MKEHIIVIYVDSITILCDQCDYKITMRGHMNGHTRFHSDGKHFDGTNVYMTVKVTTCRQFERIY